MKAMGSLEGKSLTIYVKESSSFLSQSAQEFQITGSLVRLEFLN